MSGQLVPTGPAVISPDQFDHVQRLGSALAACGYFQVSGNQTQAVAECAVKVMAGMELGIGPVASMMGINVIKGKISLSGQLMLALIEKAGGDHEDTVTADKVTIKWSRNGKYKGLTSFSIEDAQAAGLAGSHTYKNYREDMLYWRTVARGFRRYFADLGAGASVYLPDEIGGDVDPETGEKVTTKEDGINAAAEALAASMEAKGATPEQVAEAVADYKAKNAKKSRRKAAPKSPSASQSPSGTEQSAAKASRDAAAGCSLSQFTEDEQAQLRAWLGEAKGKETEAEADEWLAGCGMTPGSVIDEMLAWEESK